MCFTGLFQVRTLHIKSTQTWFTDFVRLYVALGGYFRAGMLLAYYKQELAAINALDPDKRPKPTFLYPDHYVFQPSSLG